MFSAANFAEAVTLMRVRGQCQDIDFTVCIDRSIDNGIV